MALRLYNTFGRAKKLFKPQRKGVVRLYTCGPTVYRSQTIGNYRTYIFEDSLKRVLLANKYTVKHVMNITDVGHLVSDADDGEDKLEKEAKRVNKKANIIARFYESEFKKDIKALHILPPTKFVRATGHIKEQIDLIKKLEKRGFVYKTSDGLYFDTSRVRDYGKLASKNIGGIRAGARVQRGEKKNSTDFALWKFSPSSTQRDMEWSSPWGVGFPGWHIECSAMSMKYLGQTLDIHAGGIDHIQIHHTNEIAQSESATKKPFSLFWVHSAFLTIKGQKMAKSTPETNITIDMLLSRGFDPLDFRYFVLGTHYRKPLSFSWEALEGAKNARTKIQKIFDSLPKKSPKDEWYKKKIIDVLNDDINTPKALSLFWKALNGGASQSFVIWSEKLFGLGVTTKSKSKSIPAEIQTLVNQRDEFRKNRQWQEADAVRETIAKKGFRVEDTEAGSVIHML